MKTSRIGTAPSPIAVKIVRQRVDPPGAVDEEAGDREHEEHLAELGRLELDDAEVDPALRAADRLRGDEDDEHQRERRRRRRASSAGARGRSGSSARDHEPGDADAGGDRLAHDEVVLVPGNVEARDPGDDPEPVADERRGGEQQDPVEAAQERDERGSPRSTRSATRGRWVTSIMARRDHQSVSTTVGRAALRRRRTARTP